MEIIAIMLMNGDQLVSELKSETPEHYHLEKPFVISMRSAKQNGDLEVGIFPFVAILSRQKEISLRKTAVMFTYTPDDSVTNKYREATSGIITPNQSGILLES